MSPTRLPQLGSVVWAELEDANGYRKVRPVVVVTPTAEITAGKPGRGVARMQDVSGSRSDQRRGCLSG